MSTVRAAGLFLILTLVFTWPLAAHLGTHLGGNGDHVSMAWPFWWDWYSLTQLHQSPVYTDYQFYPNLIALPSQSLATLPALVAVPVTAALGFTTSFNLALLATLWLSGLGAWLLAREVTADESASLLAGFIFAFAPVHMRHLQTHLNVASVEGLPFFMLAMLRARTSWRWAAAAGLLGALCVTLHLEGVIFVGLLLLWCGLCWRNWRQLAITCLTLGLALLPLLAVTAQNYLQSGSFPLWGMAEYGGCDLLSFVLPSPDHPLLGGLGETARVAFSQRGDGGVYQHDEGLASLGWGLLALLLIGIRARLPELHFWLGASLMFAILALGVTLHVAGYTFAWFSLDRIRVGLPLPYAIFHYLPVLKQFRNPGRMVLPLMLTAGIAASCVAAHLRRSGRSRWAMGLAALLLFEYWPSPFPGEPLPAVGPLRAVAAEPGAFAVLDLPLGWNTGFYQMGFAPGEALLEAPYHQKKILSAAMARVPPEAMAGYLRSPFLANLLLWQRVDDPPEISNILRNDLSPLQGADEQLRANARQCVEQLDLRYVICRHPERWPNTLKFVQDMLPLEKVSQAEGHLVLRIVR